MKLNKLFWLSLRGVGVIFTIYFCWVLIIILILTSYDLSSSIKFALLVVTCVLFAPLIVLFFVHRHREEEAAADRAIQEKGKLESGAAIHPLGEKKGFLSVVSSSQNPQPPLGIQLEPLQVAQL